VEARGSIDPAIVARVVRSICRSDDALLVLGGFGDPLRHPSFADILRTIRDESDIGHSVYGLAVRTTGVDLTPDIIRTMIECGVDVLDIILDAWSGDLYSQLQHPGDPAKAPLDPILAAINQVAEVRAEFGSVHPIVVPEFTKSRDNVHELDEFHDGWIRRIGTVMIGATSTFAGQFEDRRVIDMAPAARSACKRLSSRCVVLADGRVTPCDQDINGRLSMGRLPDQTLDELWLGTSYAELRRVHRNGRPDGLSLCGKCSEWHRP